MALDTNRALLVSKEYRYTIREDANIRARFPSASEIIIDTNLDEAAANTFADALFAAASSTKLTAFTFEIAQLLYPEDFTVSPPRFTLSFPRFPVSAGTTYTVTSANPNYATGKTVVTVRGS